jgi:hypothetical protein
MCEHAGLPESADRVSRVDVAPSPSARIRRPPLRGPRGAGRPCPPQAARPPWRGRARNSGPTPVPHRRGQKGERTGCWAPEWAKAAMHGLELTHPRRFLSNLLHPSLIFTRHAAASLPSGRASSRAADACTPGASNPVPSCWSRSGGAASRGCDAARTSSAIHACLNARFFSSKGLIFFGPFLGVLCFAETGTARNHRPRQNRLANRKMRRALAELARRAVTNESAAVPRCALSCGTAWPDMRGAPGARLCRALCPAARCAQ